MTRYGVLIMRKDNAEPLGVLELDPSGMLITAAFEGGANPYALGKFANGLLDQPIYKKYAEVLAQAKALSPEVVVAETEHTANLINGQEMTLGGMPILARCSQCK